VFALALAQGAGQPIVLTRYLCYTSFGALVLLVFRIMQQRSGTVRLLVTASLALALLLWGLIPLSAGVGLFTTGEYKLLVGQLDQLEKQGAWRQGDVVLFHPGFLEGDLVPTAFPPGNRVHVEGVLAAPFTTLYAGRTAKPLIRLGFSCYRSGGPGIEPGPPPGTGPVYNRDLAERLHPCHRLWIAGSHPLEGDPLRGGFVRWLEEAVGCELSVEAPGASRGNWTAGDVETARDRAGPGSAGKEEGENAGVWLLIRRKTDTAMR
jgi:hypothetical protein